MVLKNLREQIQNLLNEDEKLDERFDAFVNGVRGVEEKMRINFAGELLHFSNPQQYWLWTNWIWDPDANTGSLPLVVQEEVDLLGDTPGETYYASWASHGTGQAGWPATRFFKSGTGNIRSGCFPGLCLCGLHVHGFSSQIIR